MKSVEIGNSEKVRLGSEDYSKTISAHICLQHSVTAKKLSLG